MTTETAEKVTFNIEDGRAQLATFNTDYDSIMTQLVEAGKSSDIAAMTKLGSAMSELAIKRDKLSKRIDRASSGEGSIALETRIKSRDAALTALVNELHLSNDLGKAVTEMLVSSPGIKQIRIDVENSTITSASVVGGFRTIKAQGIKRPRATWSLDGGTTTLGSKDVVLQYGQKYGQVKSYADMTVAERNALLRKVVDGEGFVNTAAKVEAPTA